MKLQNDIIRLDFSGSSLLRRLPVENKVLKIKIIQHLIFCFLILTTIVYCEKVDAQDTFADPVRINVDFMPKAVQNWSTEWYR